MARTIGVTILVLLAMPTCWSSLAQREKPITPDTVTAIESWTVAIQSHIPSEIDEHVKRVSAWSYEEREELHTGMALFLRSLQRGNAPSRNIPARRVVELGRAAASPDANAFLKRAAIFHADVAIYGERPPATTSATPAARTQERRVGNTSGAALDGTPDHPLLLRVGLTRAQDGELIGDTVASWNWPFARFLLDQINRGKPAGDPFVGAWYHATAADMFANEEYGELNMHLDRAARILPDDARVLFDRGCYAELLGLPFMQSLVSERVIAGRRVGAQWGTPADVSNYIPETGRTNADAERLYRRALAADPSQVETRVRLARVLDLREQHKEAAALLESALAANPPAMAAFDAHLFAGRVRTALAQLDAASEHYQAARALFPDAQSALVAASQLALLRSNVPAALEPIERLGERSTAPDADPWWQYHLCTGPDSKILLMELWASVP